MSKRISFNFDLDGEDEDEKKKTKDETASQIQEPVIIAKG
jgi:hypothetical protein